VTRQALGHIQKDGCKPAHPWIRGTANHLSYYTAAYLVMLLTHISESLRMLERHWKMLLTMDPAIDKFTFNSFKISFKVGCGIY